MVLAQVAAAAGQGVFVELHLGPAVITSHPRIVARLRVRAKLPPAASCSECERLGYGRGRFMIASGLRPGALGGTRTPSLQIRRCPYWRPALFRPVRGLGARPLVSTQP